MKHYEILMCYEDQTWQTEVFDAKTEEEAQNRAYDQRHVVYAFAIRKIENAEYKEFYDVT